jgi:hypothetical protein
LGRQREYFPNFLQPLDGFDVSAEAHFHHAVVS